MIEKVYFGFKQPEPRDSRARGIATAAMMDPVLKMKEAALYKYPAPRCILLPAASSGECIRLMIVVKAKKVLCLTRLLQDQASDDERKMMT